MLDFWKLTITHRSHLALNGSAGRSLMFLDELAPSLPFQLVPLDLQG